MFDDRRIHEVARGSNLDLLIRGFHGIGNRLVDAVGSVGVGLQAIALAVSTTADNSGEVQKKIDEYSARVSRLKDDLKEAIDNQQGD